MKKQLSFEEDIRKKLENKDSNFLVSCSIINKEWYQKFLEFSNYESLKQKVSQNPKNADEIIKKAINDKTIKMDEINNLIKEKPPQPINAQALENIDNLAFVDDDFAAQILNLGQINNKDKINSNINNSNNIIINNNNGINDNQISNQPLKANIMIDKATATIQLNDKLICANISENDFNKLQVGKDEDVASTQEKNEKSEKPGSPIKPPKPPIIVNPFIPPGKPRINLDNREYSLGLDNVGATCYMNATLQCLTHIKRITEHILNYRDSGALKDTKKFRLSEAYSEVAWEIWREDAKKQSFSPNKFKAVLGEMNPLFAPTAANDAKDLLIYFIEQMHTELNQSKEENLNLIMPETMNPMNHQEVLNCFLTEFTKKYKSVFSNYFYGSNLSITNCHGCGISKYSYQCFSFLIFPLLEAKKNCVFSGRLHPSNYNNYILNIEDCFIYNQKIELFNGENQMYCNICRGSRDSSMSTKISSAPLVLILILNRGRGNLDFTEPFIFWEKIDLTRYVEFPQENNEYFLSGVVSHMGDSGPSGHFIAYCKMTVNSKWYCYNDSLVNESSFQEINSRGTPYILFYQKLEIFSNTPK